MAEVEMVAQFGRSKVTHAIRGTFHYDRTDNRTACGRAGSMGVGHYQSGRLIKVTCAQCVRTLRRKEGK